MTVLAQTVGECAEPVETMISALGTVEEALQELRKRSIQRQIVYFYAVDEENRLKGVVSTRQLLLSEPRTQIKEIMQPTVVRIHNHQTMKDAMAIFAEHSLLALPVVDQEGKLVGALDVQKLLGEKLNLQSANHRLEVFQLIGMHLEEGRKVPLLRSYRFRMPWLLCNVFSGLVCAVISRVYEGVLSKYLLLAFFIPLVLTLSESTSMQSMTQALQFLRRPRFSWRVAWGVAKREWELIWLLAITCGLVVGSFSLLWRDGLMASVTICIGIICSVAISAAFGIAIPILLHRFKLDPKVAAGPVVLMIADMLTTALYLSLAFWWLL